MTGQSLRRLMLRYDAFMEESKRIDREEPFSSRARQACDDTALELLHDFAETTGALDDGIVRLLELSGPVWAAVQQLGQSTNGLLTSLVGIAADQACNGMDTPT